MKKRLFSIICTCLLLIGLLPIPSVYGDEAVCFYVDAAAEPGGEGTKESPFATLTEAQEAVRAVNIGQTSDIYVYLRQGTHYLTEALEFTPADSGSNGFSVHYMSYPGEEVTVSGAKTLHGWTEGADGIWQTSVELPAGIDYITSMDINGVPARRAQSEEPGRFIRPFPSVSALEGFYTAAADLPHTYENQQDIQLQVAYMWRTYIYNVEEIIQNTENAEESIVTISRFVDLQAKADIPDQLSYISNGEVNWGYTIINAKEELDRPGEFYYDRTAKILYYMPRDGENMHNAKAEVPVLEKLIDVRGNALEVVQNISFSGITFAHTTWQDMARYGFHSGQSNEFYAAEEMLVYNDFVGKFIVPAAIRLNFTENLIFENNVFRALDTVGIGLYHGADYTQIYGNRFYDLADSAVTVGLPNQAYESTVVAGCNLAEGRPATSNRTAGGSRRYFATYSGPDAAVEPNKQTKWLSVTTTDENGNNEFPWWQVDLGEAYEIDRIEISARQDAVGTPNRRFFYVQASNDPTFSTYTTLATQGSNGTDASYNDTETFQAYGEWSVDIADAGAYRYVRLQKYKYKEEFCFSEVRIINESMEFCPSVMLSRHNEIQNNVITRTSQKNMGAPGIQTYFTEDVIIAHNDISSLPYSGICIGWGWKNYLDMTHSREVKVRNNRIYDVMQQMVDGGGIYNLGPQPNSEIIGNHISEVDNAVSGVYLDSGSDYLTVKNNVFEDVVLTTTGGGGTLTDNSNNFYRERTNYIEDNYSSSPFGSSASLQSVSSAGTLVEPTVFIEGNYPDSARAIVRNAGLTVKWEHLLYGVPQAAFPLSDWARYENVIHVTHKGSMHDRRFIEWHLKYFITKCEELLTMARADEGSGYGQYPTSAVNEFESTLNQVKAYYQMEYATVLAGDCQAELLLTSRQEVMNQRDLLRGALTELSQSLGSVNESGVVAVEPVTLTKVNVAKYKPVINVGGLKAGSATNINNDLPTDRIITPRTTDTKGAIGIDLQRRYPIEQVVIYDYDSGSETSAARAQFEILGSDTNNIADATVIFTLNDATNESFIANGRYVANIPGAPAYRYVFYRSLVTGAACALREIEVFSTVKATEISRNATTYTTNNIGSSGMDGAKAVDGLYNDSNSLYLKTVPTSDASYGTLGGYYNTLTVDLGAEKNVDMIEIYGRPGQTYNTDNYHGYFTLYGSHADGTVTDFEALYDENTVCGKIPKSTFESLTCSDGTTKAYTQIASQPANVRRYTTADGYTYDVFPNTTLQAPASYRTMVNRETPFRYLTHRKIATNAYHMTYIGEFIAYQFNPEAYDMINLTETGATVRFSDFNMENDTLLGSITLNDANGVVAGAVTSVSVAEGSADAVITFDSTKLTSGATYTLIVGTGATNTYGTPLAEAESFTFVYEEDYTVRDKVEPPHLSQTGENAFRFTLANNTEAEKPILAAIALYGEGNKMLAIKSVKTSVAAETSEDFELVVTNTTGETVTACKTFIWDAVMLTPMV